VEVRILIFVYLLILSIKLFIIALIGILLKRNIKVFDPKSQPLTKCIDISSVGSCVKHALFNIVSV
jgi:hypothetical protein